MFLHVIIMTLWLASGGQRFSRRGHAPLLPSLETPLKIKTKVNKYTFFCCILTILTYVRRDDGEGAQVGLPHVLSQRVGVILVVPQQRRRAALRVLDQLPVRLRFWSQDAAAHRDQVLSKRRINTSDSQRYKVSAVAFLQVLLYRVSVRFAVHLGEVDVLRGCEVEALLVDLVLQQELREAVRHLDIAAVERLCVGRGVGQQGGGLLNAPRIEERCVALQLFWLEEGKSDSNIQSLLPFIYALV